MSSGTRISDERITEIITFSWTAASSSPACKELSVAIADLIAERKQLLDEISRAKSERLLLVTIADQAYTVLGYATNSTFSGRSDLERAIAAWQNNGDENEG